MRTIHSFVDNKDASVRHRQLRPYLKLTHLAKMEYTITQQGILWTKEKWDKLLTKSPTDEIEVNYLDDFVIAAFAITSMLVYGRRLKELDNPNTDAAWKLLSRLGKEGKMESKPADLLQSFIEAEDPVTKSKMSSNEIHSECILMMQAGVDLPSHTLTWLVHFLLLYPQYHRRAGAEVRSQVDPDHIITYNKCREKLPFVEACLLEALRIAPAVGVMIPRVSPKGGVMIKGQLISENMLIIINYAIANHHSKHWDRPYEFDLTRYLDNSNARNNILSFSHGKRTCPGRHMAVWQMLSTIANILKDYDLRLPKDFKHLRPDIHNEHGTPKLMESHFFAVIKPTNPKHDCRMIISKAHNAKNK
ncbi:hypothetical protein GGI25_000538 [Coemansia spiralis]|uniref:Cytochrome P450 n=2 Tax=Coemansia TaxID=4863 RepID=A0A9W8GBL6_9FUNG|nr:hypothetical protein GGI25_000538 [Coemansia spiralis]